MKILFIVNPTAGGGDALKLWNKSKSVIFKEFPDSEYVLTKGQGDATSLAKDASNRGYDTVVSCGGDGTLNEVVNGIVGTNITLGLFPLGTGSDFGKTVGIRDLDSMILSIKSGLIQEIDIALAEFSDGRKRYFINSIEAGFGANVMNYVDTHPRHGKLSFIIGVLATLLKLKSFYSKITVDSIVAEKETIEIIVANGKYFGGGMLASPDSKIDDSLLDIHVLKPIGKLRTLLQLRELINGTYIQKGYSYEFKGEKIQIYSRNIRVEMDGEVVGETPVNITLIKKGLKMLVPNKHP